MQEIRKIESLDITGYVFVIHSGGEKDDQGRVISKLFLLHIENQPCVPVFSTLERAITIIQECKLEQQHVALDFMQVDNPKEFVNSIPYTIIADPEKTEDGKIRFNKLSC